jgi:monoamine oxidase
MTGPPTSAAPSIAIIGGGPGGMLTAHLLRRHLRVPAEVTIFEASERLGGKLVTGRFSARPVRYEAGAAELYDYSHNGPDPLRELVDALGLHARPIDGSAVIVRDRVIDGLDGTREAFGTATWRALRAFDARARRWMPAATYYDADWAPPEHDEMDELPFADLLNELPPDASRYLTVMLHSDLATEAHRTTAAYGLQNYLMNDPAYMRLYVIDGGMSEFTRRLAAALDATVRLEEPVIAVERDPAGSLRVRSRRDGRVSESPYDYVVAALPNDWFQSVEWAGDALSSAMARHHAHYDHPAHYLRVSILFASPFWRQAVSGSYFMLDRFGGCCVYDESPGDGQEGVLGWLIAGEDAMRLANLPDDAVVRRVLDELPRVLEEGRSQVLEARVHRWVGSVNALPGSYPREAMQARHVPEPSQHPNLFAVGDYMFDSTINGVMDSADFVAESIAEAVGQGPVAQ